jgi:hypothetical protein
VRVMAAEEPPQYIVSDVLLDRGNRAEMGVFVNGRRFHADFKFEAQYLALVEEVDDLFEDTDPEQPSTDVSLSTQSSDQIKVDDAYLKPCNSKCSEDPLESWILQPFIQHRIF